MLKVSLTVRTQDWDRSYRALLSNAEFRKRLLKLHTPAVPFILCVILEKLYNLIAPQFLFIYKIGIITVILPTLYFTEDQVKSCMHKHLMKYKVCANIKNFIISVNIKS